MNIFDLRGPEFLVFYFILVVLAMMFGAVLRWMLRTPGGSSPVGATQLDPYEIAYLNGRESLATEAAVARLVKGQLLQVNTAERRLLATNNMLPVGVHPLERAVHNAVQGGANDIDQLRRACKPSAAKLRERLEQHELLVTRGQAEIARIVPLLLIAAVIGIGCIKIMVGLSRQKPVAFLVVGCAATAIVGGIAFGRAVHRSRRGDAALSELMVENSALQFQGARNGDSLASDDVALAVGVFGFSILQSGPLAELVTVFKPKPPAGGGSCGSGSSCGGGGGCGGGGCGGGGCGGCGG